MAGGSGNYGDYLAKLSESPSDKTPPSLGGYYAKGRAIRGIWCGEIAKEWQIEGHEILPGDRVFAALNEGFDTRGKPLGQRRIKGRNPTFAQAVAICRRELGRKPTSEEAKARLEKMKKEGPIRFFDFTASLPKGVSIAAVTAGDEELKQLAFDCYREAVVEGLGHLAARRIRDEGHAADASETTGKALVAAYIHDLSRSNQANLHCHFVVANFTETASGERYALEPAAMAKAKDYADAVAMSRLAIGAQKLGYRVELEKDARGNVIRWDIAGISRKAKELMSDQQAKIRQAVEEFERSNGRKPSRAEEDIIQRREAEKLKKNSHEVLTEDIRREQITRLGKEWNSVQATVRQAKRARSTISQSEPGTEEREQAGRAVASALRHLEERLQIWPRYILETEAARAAFGRAGANAISQAVDVALAREQRAVLVDRRPGEPSLLRAISTPGAVKREFFAIDRIRANAGTVGPLAHFIPSEQHSQEQNEVVRALCEARGGNRFLFIEGSAGTGKTHTLKYGKKMLEAAGVRTLVVAPTRAAANVWRKDGFDATTIAAFLLQARNPKKRAELKGATVVVDESGMISGRQGVEIIRQAEASELDLRVAFVGDDKQTDSVEAGAFFSTVKAHAGSILPLVRLTEVRRQKAPQYRRIAELMGGSARTADGKLIPASVADGVQAMDELGWIHEVLPIGSGDGANEEHGGYLGAAARDYLEAVKFGTEYTREINGEKIDTAVLVAPTHEENRALTTIIRSELKARGAIDTSREHIRQTAVSLNLTQEQKVRPERYRAGEEWIVAKRELTGLRAGEMARIEGVVTATKGKSSWHEIILSNGGRVRLSKRSSAKFDVGTACEIGFAPGDRIAIRQNDKSLGLTNGDVCSVAAVEEDGTIIADDGRRIPPYFAMVTHGWSGTVESRQGSKALRVVGCGVQSDAKRAYVLFTRGVESCGFYCPDKTHFMKSVGNPGRRDSVLDELRCRQERSVEASLRSLANYAEETKSQMSDWFYRLAENIRASIKRSARLQRRHAFRAALHRKYNPAKPPRGKTTAVNPLWNFELKNRFRTRHALSDFPALHKSPKAEI